MGEKLKMKIAGGKYIAAGSVPPAACIPLRDNEIKIKGTRWRVK